MSDHVRPHVPGLFEAKKKKVFCHMECLPHVTKDEKKKKSVKLFQGA